MDSRRVDEFFILDNEVKLSQELDYSRVDEYIRSAERFVRLPSIREIKSNLKWKTFQDIPYKAKATYMFFRCLIVLV